MEDYQEIIEMCGLENLSVLPRVDSLYKARGISYDKSKSAKEKSVVVHEKNTSFVLNRLKGVDVLLISC